MVRGRIDRHAALVSMRHFFDMQVIACLSWAMMGGDRLRRRQTEHDARSSTGRPGRNRGPCSRMHPD